MGIELGEYSHRRRTIGHLHEAEEESQKWRALRAARTAYLVDACIPDWEALAHAAEAVSQIAL